MSAPRHSLCRLYMRRYWPGRAPDWVQEREGERADSEGDDASEDEEEAGVTAAIAPPVVIRASDDPRLRRLAEACAPVLAATGHAIILARLMTQEQSGVGLESCLVPAGNVSTRPGFPESAAPGPLLPGEYHRKLCSTRGVLLWDAHFVQDKTMRNPRDTCVPLVEQEKLPDLAMPPARRRATTTATSRRRRPRRASSPATEGPPRDMRPPARTRTRCGRRLPLSCK